MKQSGMYVITHVRSGATYYGSTGDFAKRKKSHISKLKNGTHENILLQELYNEDDELSWDLFKTVNADEAKDMEGAYITANLNNESMLNIATASGDGLSRHPYREDILKRISDTCRKIKLDWWAEHPKLRAILAEQNVARFSNPVAREHMSKLLTEHYEKNPEAREKLSAQMKSRWENPNERDKLLDNLKRAGEIQKADPEYKSRCSETTKRQWENPEFREKVSGVNHHSAKACSINGVIYPYAKDAASKLGIKYGTVKKRLSSDSKSFTDWFYIN